ncbi:glycosyl hydrolase [Salmonella enterica subsp. enterica]|nr:glycosyl hydrolase [Salmonella enterica subsp. enterica]
MNFDFSAPEYHELALWEDKTTLRFECADTYIALLEKLTALLGRQPELPDWGLRRRHARHSGRYGSLPAKTGYHAQRRRKSERYLGAGLVRHSHDLLWQTRDVELEVE